VNELNIVVLIFFFFFDKLYPSLSSFVLSFLCFFLHSMFVSVMLKVRQYNECTSYFVYCNLGACFRQCQTRKVLYPHPKNLIICAK
jgi:hypothetical protein